MSKRRRPIDLVEESFTPARRRGRWASTVRSEWIVVRPKVASPVAVGEIPNLAESSCFELKKPRSAVADCPLTRTKKNKPASGEQVQQYPRNKTEIRRHRSGAKHPIAAHECRLKMTAEI
jgi:hypothetical protein